MRKLIFGLLLFILPNILYSANKPVLYECEVKGCARCMFMKNEIKKLKEKYGDQIDIKVIDLYTESGRKILYKYNIDVTPTQLIFDKNGKLIYRHEGFIYFEDLEFLLKKLKCIKPRFEVR